MRITYPIVYLLLILALIVCTILARRSERPTRNAVAFLEASLIPPILGNLLIIVFSNKYIALTGHYLYYIGMDLAMAALVNFTNIYCKGIGKGKSRVKKKQKPTVMYILLTVDALQLIFNLFTGHAFSVTAIDLEGSVYFKMVPNWGQIFHRIIDYVVFGCVILIFILASKMTPKITRDRYTVILTTMIGAGLMFSYNIFFQYTIDRSVIGFAIFGLVIFYFAILYKPLRLLDRVLSIIVSNLSDAFYIFDPNGECVWANEQGCKLAGVAEGNYDAVVEGLMRIFGDSGDPNKHFEKIKVGEGDEARYYFIEENQVKDEKGQLDGSYLRIQDVTEGEHELRSRDEQIGQIKKEAFRDALTGVGNKAAYNAKISELNAMIEYGNCSFAVVMVDMNNLKHINDDYGHKAGDLYIKGCCHLICENFKHSPVFRIGGDEFVSILQGYDYENRIQIFENLRKDFIENYEKTEADAWERYSAAAGMAEKFPEDNSFESVFRRADEEMYADKKKFKEAYGTYR